MKLKLYQILKYSLSIDLQKCQRFNLKVFYFEKFSEECSFKSRFEVVCYKEKHLYYIKS